MACFISESTCIHSMTFQAAARPTASCTSSPSCGLASCLLNSVACMPAATNNINQPLVCVVVRVTVRVLARSNAAHTQAAWQNLSWCGYPSNSFGQCSCIPGVRGVQYACRMQLPTSCTCFPSKAPPTPPLPARHTCQPHKRERAAPALSLSQHRQRFSRQFQLKSAMQGERTAAHEAASLCTCSHFCQVCKQACCPK